MGRGGRGNRSRKLGRANHDPSTRKDIRHMRQFGEKHPSQDLSHQFGPPAEKKAKFTGKKRGNPRGRTSSIGTVSKREYDNRIQFGIGDEETRGQTSSESSDDEETTPYSELLSIFTGKQVGTHVQINSDDDEDESDDEDNDVSDGNDETKTDEEHKRSFGNDLTRDNEISDHDVKNVQTSKSESGNDNYLASVASDKILSKDEQSHDGDDDKLAEGDEETVIEDAEIDPELNDVMEDATNMERLDPFLQHFECEMNDALQKCLKNKPETDTHNINWPILERMLFLRQKLLFEDDEISPKVATKILEGDKLPAAKIPDPPEIPVQNATLLTLHVKSQFHDTIPQANQECRETTLLPLTSLQTEILDMASRYHDIYYPKRTENNAEEIRMVYCLHVANHVLKTRTRILHHNAKMANKSEVPESYRDQSFVRPKVLILVPFKDSALRIVKTLVALILKEEKGNVSNKKRFADEYGGQTLFMPKTNPKPEDYCVTFNGNVEDNFKLGMAITKKSIKLFTGFYSSDIIIASPLGLRMIIGAEGEKNRDYDFLSSIEVLIMDQADVFIMQNWDHVLHLMRHVHLQPTTTHGTDFARIRPWALDGLSKYYCQTMIFSSVACPEHSSLLSRYCKNYAGQVRVMPVNLRGSICHVTVQLPQVFQNFDVGSIHDVDEKRFEYFTKNVLPNFKEKLMSHTLIFVSSYFDFVRIRNFFKRDEVSFVQICEYTKDKKIARSRDLFFHGSNHFLLYTERAHFFRRHRLKGIGHIIFYQLPQNPQFYPELCNFIQENCQNKKVRQRKNSSVNIIYCKYDAPRLAPVVGTERASYMINSDKKVHAFVSGEL